MAAALSGDTGLMADFSGGDVYENTLKPNLRPGQYLGFGHGLAIHAGLLIVLSRNSPRRWWSRGR